MKRATNGEWVHIQCALWIPEVTMGDPEKMSDPNVDHIPETRRALKCHICQGGIGCVQVSLSAFHPEFSTMVSVQREKVFQILPRHLCGSKWPGDQDGAQGHRRPADFAL